MAWARGRSFFIALPTLRAVSSFPMWMWIIAAVALAVLVAAILAWPQDNSF
jgi:hypothetical protein